MKRLIARCLLIALLCLGLWAAQPVSLAAQTDDGQTPPEDTVYDQAQLQAWCEAHLSEGGRVYLGQTIELNSPLMLSSTLNAFIVIDTGTHSLVFNRGHIPLSNFEIVGEGVTAPVAEVVTAYSFRSNWVHSIQHLRITANGDSSGQGGTALQIHAQDNSQAVQLGMFLEAGAIRSYGRDAVGIKGLAELDFYCFDVAVEGENSVAVAAAPGSRFYFCRMSAEGVGAQSVSGADIVLDACRATPQPAEATVLERYFVDISGKRLYLPTAQYAPLAEITHEYTSLDFLLSGDDAPLRNFILQWDVEAAALIDTAVCGKTTVTGQLQPPFRELELERNLPLQLIVDVRDPLLPCINYVQFMQDHVSGHRYVEFRLWRNEAMEAGNYTLWRSDDLGQTWRDMTQAEEITWQWLHDDDNNGDEDYNYFRFAYDEIGAPIQFQLEIAQVGESNVVTLSPNDSGVTSCDLGGDRTGTDRNVGLEEEEPKPDDEPQPGKEKDKPQKRPPELPADETTPLAGETTLPVTNKTLPVPEAHTESTPDLDGEASESATAAGEETAPDSPDAALSASNTPKTTEPTPATATPPSGQSAAPAAPLAEWEDDTATTLSGARLAALADMHAEYIPFLKQGVHILVDSRAVAALHLQDEQQFTLVLEEANDATRVRFYLDGVAIELPYQVQEQATEQTATVTQTPPPAPPAVQTTPSLPNPAITAQQNSAWLPWAAGFAAALLAALIIARRLVRR